MNTKPMINDGPNFIIRLAQLNHVSAAVVMAVCIAVTTWIIVIVALAVGV
jgi:hypothetical protein